MIIKKAGAGINVKDSINTIKTTNAMGIYIETDSVYETVTFRDNNDVWNTDKYNWEKLMKALLTPKQYIGSFIKDFYGHVSLKRYKAAKTLYQSWTQKNHEA